MLSAFLNTFFYSFLPLFYRYTCAGKKSCFVSLVSYPGKWNGRVKYKEEEEENTCHIQFTTQLKTKQDPYKYYVSKTNNAYHVCRKRRSRQRAVTTRAFYARSMHVQSPKYRVSEFIHYYTISVIKAFKAVWNSARQPTLTPGSKCLNTHACSQLEAERGAQHLSDDTW